MAHIRAFGQSWRFYDTPGVINCLPTTEKNAPRPSHHFNGYPYTGKGGNYIKTAPGPEMIYWPIQISRMFMAKNRPIDNKVAFCQLMDWPLKRRQAITWTNADTVHWHICASLGDKASNAILYNVCDAYFVMFNIWINQNGLSGPPTCAKVDVCSLIPQNIV